MDNLWWSKISAELQLQVSEGIYNAWLRPLKIKSVDENQDKIEVTLTCPSIFHKQQLELKYQALIRELISNRFGKTTNLSIVVERQKNDKESGEGLDLFSRDPEKEVVNHYQEKVAKLGLNPLYTFENFAVSSSNEVAHAATKTAAKKPGQAYPLIFLYGGVGVGKTHLMQALGHEVLKQKPSTAVIYCTGEDFTNDIIEAIRNKSTAGFRQRYRQAKILLIDDVQFIGGKDAVQEEFFHTFNAISKEGGQIFLTSDRLPSQIAGLEDRLRSRFEGGLTIDIQQPEFELRTAILLIKAQQKKLTLTMRVAQTIAANVDSARKLEGVLMRLSGEALVRKSELTEDLVLNLLDKAGNGVGVKPATTAKKILEATAKHYNYKVSDVKGEKRTQSLATARQVCMYLMRKELKLPYEEIGLVLGNRDHTTIMHGEEKISRLLVESDELRQELNKIKGEIYG